MRMSTTILCLALLVPAHQAAAKLDPEDQKLIDEASCEEIQREYRNYSQAEREVEAEIRKSNAGTAAANVAGIAAFALLGFGFFTWNDNSDLQETLAELREIRVAIGEGARKKNCRL